MDDRPYHLYDAPPAMSRGGRRWGWLVGAVGGIGALLLVVVVVVVVRGHSRSAAPAPDRPVAPAMPTTVVSAPTVRTENLASYLASAQQVSSMIGNVPVTSGALVYKRFTGFFVEPLECAGALIPGIDVAYAGAGVDGFVGQPVSDDLMEHKVIQTIARFATAEDASAFARDQALAWSRCAGRAATVTDPSGSSVATIVGSADTAGDGVTSVTITPSRGGGDRRCGHAMAARRNAVIDVRVCDPSGGAAAVSVVRAIGDAVSAATAH